MRLCADDGANARIRNGRGTRPATKGVACRVDPEKTLSSKTDLFPPVQVRPGHSGRPETVPPFRLIYSGIAPAPIGAPDEEMHGASASSMAWIENMYWQKPERHPISPATVRRVAGAQNVSQGGLIPLFAPRQRSPSRRLCIWADGAGQSEHYGQFTPLCTL